VLKPAYVFCAKAKRQQHGFICAKAKRQQHGFICAKAKRQQQHDVGHFGIATGRGVLGLSASISAGVWTLAERSEKYLTTFDLLRIMRY